MSDVLCIYYSFSGNTRRAMKEIADALGAEIVAIDDGADRNGWRGRLRAGKDAMRRTTAPLVSSFCTASYRLCHVRLPTVPSTVSPACSCQARTARVVAAP